MLAREVAMDIFPIEQILELHKLSQDEWLKILEHPTFRKMLDDMSRQWQATMNVGDRVKAKAATGLESQLEVYIRDIGNPLIPLAQRVEAGKFLARLGELDGARLAQGAGSGGQVVINIVTSDANRLTIEGRKTLDLTPVIPDATE